MNIYDKIRTRNIIEINQGSTFNSTIELRQPSGLPMNLTSYSVQAQICTLAGIAVASFNCTITDAVNGKISQHLDVSATAKLIPSLAASMIWGMQLTAPDGTVMEISGGVIVNPEVVK